MIPTTTVHILLGETANAVIDFETVGAEPDDHVTATWGGTSLEWPSPAVAVAQLMAMISDVIPELDHAQLVAARYGLDRLGVRCSDFAAEAEGLLQGDALARLADERGEA